MTDYFAFFGIKPSFFPDLKELKQLFYAKSREFHPDFFTRASEDRQLDALEQSSIINVAYKTLLSPELRFKHILEIEGVINEETKDEMGQSFLMDMMDFNEQIMDLEFDFSSSVFERLKDQLDTIRTEKYTANKPIMNQYPNLDPDALARLKNLYFENKYLDRLAENLLSLKQRQE